MGTLNRNTRLTTMGSIMAAMGKFFGNTPKHQKPQYGRPSKRFRCLKVTHNPAGSKIRRAIRRGNHGVVNKHGTIAAAIAEDQRQKWLFDHSYPCIMLSTSI
ncbi:MAG: hypothetical protein KAS93_06660 [Gammaproteobacteria bacterium]|nr:hypothetical protein [Gammaproteobacteria bacterium]